MPSASPAVARAWVAVATGLALASLLLWFAPREALDWQPRFALTQPWRWWSAAFVHWSTLHLAANLAGCVVVAAFGIAARLPRHAAWAWLAAWPITHLALVLQPRLLDYGGLSGVLHAGVAVAALHLAWRESGRRRAIAVAVLAGLALKLVLERPWAGPTQQVAGWDFDVAPLAHLTGVCAGLLCGAVADVIAGRHATPLR